MTQEQEPPSSSERSPSPSPRKLLFTWAWIGAIAGYVCSSPVSDWTFDNVNLVQLSGGILGAAVLFGLPAGLILGWLDSRRGNRKGWQAIVKVPTIMIGGALLLFGIFIIPITIDVLARSGSEWLAGAAGDSLARRAFGAVVGACFGLIVPPLLLMSTHVSNERKKSV